MAKAAASQSLKDILSQIESITAWLESADGGDVELGIEKVRTGAKLLKEAKERFGTIENEFRTIEESLQSL